MNVNNLIRLLQEQQPSALHWAFLKGAARTEAYVITDDPRALVDLLPNHRFVSTDKIHTLPKGANVIFDPLLLSALVGKLIEGNKPVDKELVL